MEFLERHFDAAFSAHDGVKKLRELILTLAMEGKLVPQDPNDPPASKLLKEIEIEKKRLAKAGKIRIPRPLQQVNPEEFPFEVPKGWAWVKLGESMLKITDGTHHSPPNGDRGDFLYISAKNIKDEGVMLSNATFVTRDIHDEIFSRCDPEYGNILYIKDGATTGVVTINNLKEPFSMLSSVALLKQPHGINNRYLFFALKAPFFYEAMRSGMTGVAITRVTLTKLQEAIIPLAPYEEQLRIVSKIDELMKRCDAFERLRAERDAKRLAVHSGAVHQLLNVADTEGHIQAREFLGHHFDELYTVKENVAELRKAILQLAVMGKLVPQDPNDTPASELLKQIEAGKKRRVKEGKIKASRPQAGLPQNEGSYSLPPGWMWTRLNDVLDVRDGTHDTPKYVEVGYPLVTSKNISSGTLNLNDIFYISEEDHRKISERSRVDRGDILFAMIGSIGNPVIVDCDTEFSIKNVALFKYYQSGKPHNRYLHYYLLFAQEEMKAKSSGAVQSFVSLGFLRNYPFPMPPLQEQHRIVAKIDQLMSMCDNLEQQIDASRQSQSALLNATMAQYGGQRCA